SSRAKHKDPRGPRGEDMRMTRLMRAAALFALLATWLSASAEDKASLRLNWYLGGLHAPFYYGKEQGFYKAEGIDLTINEGRGSANTVQAGTAGCGPRR